MPRPTLALIVTAMCLFPSTPIALAQQPGNGPFGFRKGMTQAELEKIAGPLKPEQPGVYTPKRVPKPNPDFGLYALVMTPQTGLCAVMAGGRPVQTDASGTQIQAAFSSLKNTLARTYGAPKVADALRAGSTLNKPQDWTNALAKDARVLAAGWVLKGNPDGIGKIELSAIGLSSSKAYLTLTYGFDIPGACIEEVKQLRRATLNEPPKPGSM